MSAPAREPGFVTAAPRPALAFRGRAGELAPVVLKNAAGMADERLQRVAQDLVPDLARQHGRDPVRGEDIVAELLTGDGIGTAGMARFFERLEAEGPDIFGRMGDLGALLSTHPDPHSRSEEAERAATADAVAALTPAPWAALRSICD